MSAAPPVHPARRLWEALEPLHGAIYHDARVRETGVALGLRGYWPTYFAFRAAPLGRVGAPTVIGLFAGFAPRMVERAIPAVWDAVSPAAALDARSTAGTRALRDAGVDLQVASEVVALLRPAIEGLEPGGRALGAANAALPLPRDPVGALWQLATTVREYRGDGHVASLLTLEITQFHAHLLQAAAGRVPLETAETFRGWTSEEVARHHGELRARRLLTPADPPRLTAEGAALLDAVEARTDEAAWSGGLRALGEPGVVRAVALLEPQVRQVVDAGLVAEPGRSGGGVLRR